MSHHDEPTPQDRPVLAKRNGQRNLNDDGLITPRTSRGTPSSHDSDGNISAISPVSPPNPLNRPLPLLPPNGNGQLSSRRNRKTPSSHDSNGNTSAILSVSPPSPLNRPLHPLPHNRNGQPSSNINLGGDGLITRKRNRDTPSSHDSDGNTSTLSSVSPSTRGRKQDSSVTSGNESLVYRPGSLPRNDQEQCDQPQRAQDQGIRSTGKRVRKKDNPTYTYADYRKLGMKATRGTLRQEPSDHLSASGGSSISQASGSQGDFLSDQEFPTALSMRGPGSRYEIINALINRIGPSEQVTWRRIRENERMPVPLVQVTDVDLTENSHSASTALANDSNRTTSNNFAGPSTISSQSTPATTRRQSDRRDNLINATRRALIQQVEVIVSEPPSPVIQLDHRGHDLGFRPPSIAQRNVVEWLSACHQIHTGESGSDSSLAPPEDNTVDENHLPSVYDPTALQDGPEDLTTDDQNSQFSFTDGDSASFQADPPLTVSSVDVREFLRETEDLMRFDSFEDTVMMWLERVGGE